MRTRYFAIGLCLCVLHSVSCGKSDLALHTATQDSADKPEHKVVQMDWNAELAERQKELEHDPNSAFLHNQIAVAYNALGDFVDFDREIQTAMKLDPTNTMHCYLAYAVYKRRGLRDRAVAVLEKALQIDADNPFGHYEKARLLEDAKEWQRALKEYKTAQQLLQRVKSDPQNFQQGNWRYTDPRGNPFDVGFDEPRIADDIARVRAAAPSRQ